MAKGLNLRIVSPLKFSSMKKIIFKTIKQGARAGGSLINQAGVGVDFSQWTPAVWLHPVTSRGVVSDRCYLSIPTLAAPAVAAAMCSVEERGFIPGLGSLFSGGVYWPCMANGTGVPSGRRLSATLAE